LGIPHKALLLHIISVPLPHHAVNLAAIGHRVVRYKKAGITAFGHVSKEVLNIHGIVLVCFQPYALDHPVGYVSCPGQAGEQRKIQILISQKLLSDLAACSSYSHNAQLHLIASRLSLKIGMTNMPADKSSSNRLESFAASDWSG